MILYKLFLNSSQVICYFRNIFTVYVCVVWVLKKIKNATIIRPFRISYIIYYEKRLCIPNMAFLCHIIWFWMIYSHKHCIHDLNEIKITTHKHDSIYSYHGQYSTNDSNFENIRIHVNTDQLSKDWSNDILLLNYFKYEIIPASVKYISNIIGVRPVNGNLTYDLNTMCNKYNSTTNICESISDDYNKCGEYIRIPSNDFNGTLMLKNGTIIYGGYGEESDLNIYFSGNDDNVYCCNSYAFARVCHKNLHDRPIGGYINLCKSSLISNITNYKSWEIDTNIIIHEIIHILGFSKFMFPFYRNDDLSPKTARDANGEFSACILMR